MRLRAPYTESVSRSESLRVYVNRITHERGCLRHDDRLDALAMGVGYFSEQMARDEEQGIKMIQDAALDKELELFMENALDPTGFRGGQRQEKTMISRYMR